MEEPFPLGFSCILSPLHEQMGDDPLGNGAGEDFPGAREPRGGIQELLGWENIPGRAFLEEHSQFGATTLLSPPIKQVTLPLLAVTGPSPPSPGNSPSHPSTPEPLFPQTQLPEQESGSSRAPLPGNSHFPSRSVRGSR